MFLFSQQCLENLNLLVPEPQLTMSITSHAAKSGQQIKNATLSSICKTVSQIDVLPSLRIAIPVSGEAGQKYSIHDKLQGINLTAETMQTNMSPLTDLDVHDQFAKPQSNSAVLLKKGTLP